MAPETLTETTDVVAAVAPPGPSREVEARRKRQTRFRQRIRRQVWRGRALVADPGACPYRTAPGAEDPCGGCTAGLPCRLEVALWETCFDDARRVMSPSSASLRATLEVQVARLLARGGDALPVLLKLYQVQIADERRREYQEHLTARFKAEIAAKPRPFNEILQELVSAPAPAIAAPASTPRTSGAPDAATGQGGPPA